jgi:hypothetical protein
MSQTHLGLHRWYHVAVTDNAGEIRLYIDGLLDKACDGGYGIPAQISASVMIGRTNPDSLFYFDGIIDEVAVFDRAITADEIQAMMYTKLAGSEPNLVAYWDFDQGTGQTATDISGHSNDGILGSNVEPDAADPCWVESDAPIGQCTAEQVMVRNLLGATEDKAAAIQSIDDAKAKERASLELIEELRRHMRGHEQREALWAKAKICIALLQEQIASRQIDATIRRLEEALLLLGYEVDPNSAPASR